MATCTLEYRCGCKQHLDRNDRWLKERAEGVCPTHKEKLVKMTFDPFQQASELVPGMKRAPAEGEG